MFLNGRKDVQLQGVRVNGAVLVEADYELTERSLLITAPPAGDFELEITTLIKPQENTSLEGLYKSGGNFCTQV